MSNASPNPIADGMSSIWGPIALGVLAMWYVGTQTDLIAPNPLHNSAVGTEFADWRLRPLTGAPEPLTASGSRGRVVLLNFFGTWCGPCRQEFPRLVQIAHRFGNVRGFVFAPVSCAAGNDADRDRLRHNTEAYLSEIGARLPVYCDPSGDARRSTPGLRGYPHTIVLDQKGIVRGVWRGYASGSEQEIEQLVCQLLSDQGPHVASAHAVAR